MLNWSYILSYRTVLQVSFIYLLYTLPLLGAHFIYLTTGRYAIF